ncbi:hypothetical protein QOZ80_8AG0630590 [Eleusine coracana subsp. coracana]|nr:hypothetical protein QOZ80_8AG0630590 [Eleusine coracana subsp. coracana]
MPPPAAATTTARPRRRRLLKAVAAFLRLIEDAVLYGFLAVAWGNSVGGTFVEVLGRWVCGQGSSMEAAGLAVAARCRFVMVRLLPIFLPLLRMRISKRAKFDRAKEEKERREKEDMEKALCHAIVMQLRHEEGSFMWRVGSVLFDVAHLGIAVVVAFWGVRNIVILVTVPRVKDGDDVML